MRAFRDFMKKPDVVASFKFRKIQLRPVVIPTREQLQRFYQSLHTPIARALFLMYASSGLRKMELLSLTKDDVDWDKRMIVPHNHNGETKKSWVAFFNQEAEKALKEYLATRRDGSPRLFRISLQSFVDVFQGRVPKSVIARFYTGRELERLKRIYDKAELKALIQARVYARVRLKSP